MTLRDLAAKERWRIAALLLFTLALYARTLGLPLHHSDDVVYLADPRLSPLSWSNLVSIFTSTFLANYHPVTTLTYAIDRALFGSWLPGYHATHLALYLVGVVLVYRLLSRLLANPTVAWLAAAAFAAHTLHVEVLAWLAQRKDVVCLVFYVGTLLTYIRYVDSERRSWRAYLATHALMLLAMLAKGYAVVLPAVLVAYDLTFATPHGRRWLVDKLPGLGLAGFITVATFLAQDKDSALMAADALSITLGQRIIANGMVVAAYVGRTLLPIDLSFSYAVGPFWLSAPVALVGIAIVIASIVTFVKTRRKVPAVAFGVALYALPLATVMNVFWTLATWMNDRYLFLPTIGSSLILAGAGLTLYPRLAPTWRKSLIGAAVLLVVLYAALTEVRIGVWTSEVRLRSDALRQQLSLGGDGPVTAADIRKKRVTVLPNLNAFLSLVEAYERAGEPATAAELKGVFASLQEGGDMESKLSIAKQEIDAGRLDDAIARLKPAAESKQWHAAEAWNLIGLAHERAKRPELAREAYLQYLERLQSKGMSAVGVMLRLGGLEADQGHAAEALAWYEKADKASEPGDPRAAARLATALERAGRVEEAYAQSQRALAMEGKVPPTVTFSFTDLQVSTGLVAERLGRRDEALAHFEAAAKASTDPAQRRQIQVKRAMLTEAAGRDAEALMLLEAVLGDPALAERDVLLIRAAEIAERSHKPEVAVRHLETLLAAFPQHPQRPQVVLKIGTLLEQLGRIDDAIARYEQGLTLAPNYPDAPAVRAHIEQLKTQPKR